MIAGIRHRMRKWTPPWMQRFHMWRYLYSHGLLADSMIEAGLQGMIARLPGVGTPTALPRIARDRKIRRGFNEPDAVFADRLVPWRSEHKRKGNPYALMRQVRGLVSPLKPRMRVVNSNGEWFTLNSDDTTERHSTYPTPNWVWDEQTLSTRAWLILYSTGAEAPWQRDGTWGDGELWGDSETSTWGSTATPLEVRAVRDVVREWKSAGTKYENIIIAFSDDAFDPEDTSPPNPDGTWELFQNRDDRAIYWDGAA